MNHPPLFSEISHLKRPSASCRQRPREITVPCPAGRASVFVLGEWWLSIGLYTLNGGFMVVFYWFIWFIYQT